MADPIAADRIEITVLVDNVTDSLSSTPSFVTREWVRLQRQGMKRTMGGALCCANHGLSLVVRAEVGGKSRTVLFDGGPVDYAVERNGTRLGVDFAAIDGDQFFSATGPDVCGSVCPGDLNSDNVVDSSDMGGLLGAFGPCPLGTPGDFNDDEVIDSADLGSMLGVFGDCP